MMISLNQELLYEIFIFLFGKPHQAMYAATTMTAINAMLNIYEEYKKDKLAKEFIEKNVFQFLGYGVFLIIATRMDALAVDAVFGWEGSTQFLVCIYIIGKKIKEILFYMQSKGLEIPGVLAKRIEQMSEEENIRLDSRLNELENRLNQFRENNSNNLYQNDTDDNR